MESMKMKMLLLIALLGLGTQVKAVDILSVAGIDATNSSNAATLSAMGVSYSSNTKRLTLNNATIVATGTTSGIVTNVAGLTIRVSGISTITAENAPAIAFQGGSSTSAFAILGASSSALYAKGKSGMYLSGTSATVGVLIRNGVEVTLEATNGAGIYGDKTQVGKNIFTYYADVTVQDAATSLILKGTTAAVADVNTFGMTDVAIQYPSGVSFAKPRINTTNWVHITGQGLPIEATNFPDATFRTHVANYDIHQDGYLSRYERSLVTSMDVSNQGIADMTGIGYFTKLTTFNCSGNADLVSLDLSANTELERLNIDGCTSLTSLKAFGHVLELVGATEPTCTTSGNVEHWHCTHCDTYYFDASCTQPTTLEGVTIPALGHALEHVEGVAVTCTTDGRLEYWYCTRCGNYYLDASCTEPTTLADTHVPALGHNLEYIEAAAPTCTTNGNMEYWHCVRCGNYYHDGTCTELTTLADVTIPALGHELEHVEAVDVTCTANGNIEYWHCTRCGNYYYDAECTQSTTLAGVTIPALGHDFDEGHFCNRCGKGEPAELVDGYYQIRYPGNLYWFAEYVNDGNRNINAKLVDDITINTNVVAANGSNNGFRIWTPIGNATTNSYQGTFDGQQHTVSGLYRVSNNYTGLFGCISGATIKDVTIADSYFRGASYISFVCGYASGDGNIIRNCHTAGKMFVTNQYGGGICGYFEGGRISGCTNSGSLSGNYSNNNGKYLGGICGYTSGSNYTRTIEDCSNSGSIRQDYEMAQYFSVGGICGNAQFATIIRCSNSGEIVQYSPSTGSPSRYAGGICGYFNGTIIDCYNTGTVKSNDKDQNNMGGICGYMFGTGSITNSYNVGTISGYSYVGSICGSLTANSTVSNCFYLANSARSNMRSGMSNAGVYQYGIGCQSYSQNLADVEGHTTSATSAEFASGSICYALNDSTSNGDLAWFQILETDATPMFEGQVVYYDRSQNIYTNTQPIIVRGDMNNDGVLTTADVIVLVNYLLGLPTDGVTYDDDIADVDGNGTPSIADVTELVNQIQEAQQQ